MNWREMMQRRPETLSILEWHNLLSAFDQLEKDKLAAVRRRLPFNCLVVDAVGFEHEFDLKRVGYTTPPRKFRLPVRQAPTSAAFLSTDAIPSAPKYHWREFELVGIRTWDQIPLYEEVVE